MVIQEMSDIVHTIPVPKLQKGHVIYNGDKRPTPVKTVTHNACSSYGTHVNDSACYDRWATVQIIEIPESETEQTDNESTRLQSGNRPSNRKRTTSRNRSGHR